MKLSHAEEAAWNLGEELSYVTMATGWHNVLNLVTDQLFPPFLWPGPIRAVS